MSVKIEVGERGRANATGQVSVCIQRSIPQTWTPCWVKILKQAFYQGLGLPAQFCHQQPNGAECKALPFSVPQFPFMINRSSELDYLIFYPDYKVLFLK